MHDTRATFITVKLANGRTETWISDRTGHSSSDQSHNYKRAARKVAELALGDFAPLDEAIPELAGKGGSVGGSGRASEESEEPAASSTSDAVSLASAPSEGALAFGDEAALPEVDAVVAEERRAGHIERGPGQR
ncbi:hypothetical protein [Sorangium sp. So ce406]|uniref:hypothetical protein n=1 Tax=Sorangium sp. So ce406 TaxID=3133311 RepID=UPI003F5CA269